MGNKIIAFDFDKTLSHKDTLLGFYIHTIKWYKFYNIGIYTIFAILHKLKLISNIKLKEFGVTIFLKGMKKEDFLRLAKEYAYTIKTNFLFKQVEEMSKNNKVYIVSASFTDYLAPLFSKSIIVFGSEVTYQDNNILELKTNCYGKNKVLVLSSNGILLLDDFYTDSYSDLPLMEMSKHVFLVKNNKLEKIK